VYLAGHAAVEVVGLECEHPCIGGRELVSRAKAIEASSKRADRSVRGLRIVRGHGGSDALDITVQLRCAARIQ
jgi:hypothetical protein